MNENIVGKGNVQVPVARGSVARHNPYAPVSDDRHQEAVDDFRDRVRLWNTRYMGASHTPADARHHQALVERGLA